MGNLLEEPIFVVIALTDGVGDVIGKEKRIAEAPAPEPVVVAVALEEFVGGAVGVADFPDLFAVADGRPVELAEVEIFSCLDGDAGLCEFAEHTVGESVKGVFAGADVVDVEFAVVGSVGPELVIIPVVLPGDEISVAVEPLLEQCSDAGVIGVGEADSEMGKFG